MWKFLLGAGLVQLSATGSWLPCSQAHAFIHIHHPQLCSWLHTFVCLVIPMTVHVSSFQPYYPILKLATENSSIEEQNGMQCLR